MNLIKKDFIFENVGKLKGVGAAIVEIFKKEKNRKN